MSKIIMVFETRLRIGSNMSYVQVPTPLYVEKYKTTKNLLYLQAATFTKREKYRNLIIKKYICSGEKENKHLYNLLESGVQRITG